MSAKKSVIIEPFRAPITRMQCDIFNSYYLAMTVAPVDIANKIIFEVLYNDELLLLVSHAVICECKQPSV